ncbi:MAG: hypothetical protein AB7R69_05690 [Candidatus Babeliales bacterium]
MFFYRKDTLEHANDASSSLKIFIMTSLFIILAFLGATVLTLLPKIYFYSFTYAKIYLDKRVNSPQLIVKVYSDFTELFLAINIFLLVLGFLFCFSISKSSVKDFLKKIIPITWRIHTKIIIVSGLLLTLCIAFFTLYFSYKFLLLQKESAPKAPLPFLPFKLLSKLTGTYPSFKNLWNQIHALPKAQKIFNQINKVSLYTYWGCQIGSSLSTLWLVLNVQEKLRIMQKKI